LAGAGAWLLVFLGAREVKCGFIFDKTRYVMGVVSLILLVAGGLFSVTHLSHPDRMMAALGHPTSGIFMEALFIGLSALAAIIYLVLVNRKASSQAIKVVAVVAAIIAFALTFILGFSYIIPARPMWDTILLPVAYLGTAMSFGASLYLVLLAICKEDEGLRFGGLMLLIAGICSVITSLAFGFISGAIMGEQALLFWGVVVALGGVVPAICGFIARIKPGQALMLATIAILGSALGCVAFRCIMWLVGTGIRDYFEIAIG